MSHLFLAIYDTSIQSFAYTGSEHVGITDNQVSLTFPITIHAGIGLHPRHYEGAVFEMQSCSASFAVRQSSIHWGAPKLMFNPSTNECALLGDCTIQHVV